MGVPGMTMHHVSLEALAGKGQAGAQSFEGRGEARELATKGALCG